MSLVQECLGKYFQHFYMAGFETVTLSVYLVVLARGYQTRSFYPLRLLLVVMAQLLACVPLSILRTDYDQIMIRVAFDCALLLLFFCSVFFLYQEGISEILLIFASVVVSKNFSGTVIPLLRNLFGRSDLDSVSFFAEFVPLRDWAIYYGLQAAFLAGIAILFAWTDRNRDMSIDLPGAVLLSLSAFLIRGIIHPVARSYQPMSFELAVCVKVLMLVIYFMIISIRAGLLSRQRMQTELMMTEELLIREQKRYAEMRDSIEVINMKCHDIQHQLSAFQGRLTEHEISALEQAIQIYDSNINTGNKIVDTVLYQKNLSCEKHNIKLHWMVDGRLLSFITPSKLYSILVNALDNGIEAVMSLEAEKRIISLTVFCEGKDVIIETANYFDPSRRPIAGTSKEDKLHHGYGLKSIAYIAAGYGGTVQNTEADNIFILPISIPRDI